MAKNTNTTGFRQIDIDSYDPENYRDDDDQANIQQDEGVSGPNESEIVSLLNTKKNLDALNAVLRNAPYNSKNQQLKVTIRDIRRIVMKVLRSFPNATEIDNAVKSLDPTSLDVLMKYIYKGFEREPRDSSHLLTWHEKAYAIGGNGCIVRVLTDGKRV